MPLRRDAPERPRSPAPGQDRRPGALPEFDAGNRFDQPMHIFGMNVADRADLVPQRSSKRRSCIETAGWVSPSIRAALEKERVCSRASKALIWLKLIMSRFDSDSGMHP